MAYIGSGKSSGHSSLLGGIAHDIAKAAGGVAKFGTNLADDTEHAVTGIPTGAAEIATHPKEAGKAIVRQTWHDWAPLVEGHPVQFLKQTYDHPLAPLLDVATVFSAGAGAAAKLGDVAVAAGSDSALAKAASDLGKARVRAVNPPASDVVPKAAKVSYVEDPSALARRDARVASLDQKIRGIQGRLEPPKQLSDIESKLVERGKAIGQPKPSVLDRYMPPGPPAAADRLQSQLDGLVRERDQLAKSTVPKIKKTEAVAQDVPPKSMTKTYSANAGANLRRTLANRAMLSLEPHLPAWFQQTAREGRLYSRLTHVEDAHKLFAQHVQTAALMKAAKVVNDPAAQRYLQPAIKQHVATNIHRFSTVKAGEPGEHVLSPGELYVRRDMSKAIKYDPQQPLEKWMENAGRYLTTDNPKLAALGEGGYRVVRSDIVKQYTREGADSTRFLKKLPAKATTWWKRINVGYAPRTITNNVVGNYFMYAMKTAGHGSARGLVDAIRYARGTHAASRAFNDMHAHILEHDGPEQAARFVAAAHPALHDVVDEQAIRGAFGDRAAKAVSRQPNWVQKYFKNEIGNTFGNALDMAEAGTGVRGKVAGAARSGFYPVVHRVADQPVRIATLYNYVRRSPEVRAYLKTHPGESIDAAAEKVLDRNPNQLRERAVQHVRSVAGDYVTRGPVEKLIQGIVPFYLWDKHIVQHVGSMASDQPGRLALAQNVSRMGNDEVNKLLGSLPSYLGNVLPLSMLGLHGHNERIPILSTQGLNPYSSIGELAQTAAAYTTGEGTEQGTDAANSLSPLLTGLVEQLSGHRLGSSAAASTHGGVLPSIIGNTASSLGYAQLIQHLMGGGQGDVTSSGKPTIYAHTPSESITGLLGVPIKGLSQAAASAATAKQGSKKKHAARIY